jgi:hypothetical protein
MRDQAPPTWVKTLVRSLLSSKFVAAGALLGAVLLAPGCSDMPTDPSGQSQLSQENGLGTSSLALISGKTEGPEWTVTQLMYRHGGSMELDGQRLVCNFSRNALPVNQATITATMKLNAPQGQATRIDLDFQPSMTFEKPVTLTIEGTYLAGTGNTYTLWYFDPILRKWMRQATNVFSPSSPTTFNLYHYSAYALTR